jgi:hypothetical protein
MVKPKLLKKQLKAVCLTMEEGELTSAANGLVRRFIVLPPTSSDGRNQTAVKRRFEEVISTVSNGTKFLDSKVFFKHYKVTHHKLATNAIKVEEQLTELFPEASGEILTGKISPQVITALTTRAVSGDNPLRVFLCSGRQVTQAFAAMLAMNKKFTKRLHQVAEATLPQWALFVSFVTDQNGNQIWQYLLLDGGIIKQCFVCTQCRACLRLVNVDDAVVTTCSTCKHHFCLDCDEFAHLELHNCPGCMLHA